MGYNKGGVPSFKACADCPSPAKCAKQGCQKAKAKMAKGGVVEKPMSKGMKALKKAAPAVAKRMGYKKGGYVACGASNPGTQKRSTK